MSRVTSFVKCIIEVCESQRADVLEAVGTELVALAGLCVRQREHLEAAQGAAVRMRADRPPGWDEVRLLALRAVEMARLEERPRVSRRSGASSPCCRAPPSAAPPAAIATRTCENWCKSISLSKVHTM